MQDIVKQKLDYVKNDILQEVFEQDDCLHYDMIEQIRLEKMLKELITDKNASLVLQDLMFICNSCCEQKCDLAYKAGIAVANQLLKNN